MVKAPKIIQRTLMATQFKKSPPPVIVAPPPTKDPVLSEKSLPMNQTIGTTEEKQSDVDLENEPNEGRIASSRSVGEPERPGS